MFFDKLLEEKNLSEFLEKIERCRESCWTDEGIDCLDNLEYDIADRLDSVQKFFDY